MSSDDRHRPNRRGVMKRRSFIDDGEIYRDILERPIVAEEERTELDSAESANDHLRLYRQATEEILREGGA